MTTCSKINDDPARLRQRTEALFAAGYAFQKDGQFHKAVGAYQEILRSDPNHDGAHNNLGNCLRSLGRFAESLEHYDAALRIKPDKESAMLNRSLALLALNRYEEAWPGYEKRLGTIDFRSEVLATGKPRWDGSVLAPDQILYVYSNQGIGDELQTLRYLPEVVRRAPTIILEVHRAVFDLVKSIPRLRAAIRPEKNRTLPKFDFHCELFSLPGLFGTRFDTVPPAYRPPFQPDPAVSAMISAEREKHPGKKHAGIVWSGNPKNELNPYRACGLVHFLPLLNLGGIRFHSLQKGAPRQDLAQFQVPPALLHDLSPCLETMASTATALDELDLLISVDTSVPHLAGTIGTPAWVLLHQPADWRWTVGESRTPWYPRIRLFRQRRPHYWKDLFEEVGVELAAWASQTGS